LNLNISNNRKSCATKPWGGKQRPGERNLKIKTRDKKSRETVPGSIRLSKKKDNPILVFFRFYSSFRNKFAKVKILRSTRFMFEDMYF
jgi:hypothetical protein